MLEIIKNDLVDDLDLTPFNNDQSKIALIDADSMLYYCMKEDTTFDEMKLKLDNFIINVLSELKCKYFTPFTTNSKTVFRKEFGKTREYKGNRKGRETPFLFYALRVYAQREWGFYDIPRIEADDAVAIYANGLGNNPFIESVICSPDKDVLRQIPGTHYNYQRNEFVSTTDEDAAKFLWIQCAAGDSVDGIPGIPGIGVKRAEKALDGIVEEDFSLKILKMYLQQMEESDIASSKEATDKFKETLDLVYVLRSSYDLDRLGISLPPLKYFNILKKLGKCPEEVEKGIQIKDSLTVKAVGYIDVEVEFDGDGNITAVELPEVPKITLGKTLTIGRSKFPYKINMITSAGPENNTSYEMTMARRTKASLFILPMLSGNRKNYFYDNLLLNCFVGTEEHKNVIALLYRFSGKKEFVDFEHYLKGLDNFIECVDISNKTTLYIFNVPEKYKKEFNLFLAGRYSKFDSKYKLKILRFHGFTKDSTLGKILYKAASRRKQLETALGPDVTIEKSAELYSIPNMTQEIYDPTIYDI